MPYHQPPGFFILRCPCRRHFLTTHISTNSTLYSGKCHTGCDSMKVLRSGRLDKNSNVTISCHSVDPALVVGCWKSTVTGHGVPLKPRNSVLATSRRQHAGGNAVTSKLHLFCCHVSQLACRDTGNKCHQLYTASSNETVGSHDPYDVSLTSSVHREKFIIISSIICNTIS
jgi:hypothetical protein